MVSGLPDGIDSALIPEQELERTMQYMTNLQLELHKYETDDNVAKVLAKDARGQVDNMGTRAENAIFGRYIRMERGNLGLNRT